MDVWRLSCPSVPVTLASLWISCVTKFSCQGRRRNFMAFVGLQVYSPTNVIKYIAVGHLDPSARANLANCGRWVAAFIT